MANIIVKQSNNNRYCVFSTVVDNIILYDANIDDLVDFMLEKERERILNFVNQNLEKANKNHRSININEILIRIRHIHGEKEFNRVKKLIKDE